MGGLPSTLMVSLDHRWAPLDLGPMDATSGARPNIAHRDRTIMLTRPSSCRRARRPQSELGRVSHAKVLSLVAEDGVAPRMEPHPWSYADNVFPCWIVFEHRASNTGVVTLRITSITDRARGHYGDSYNARRPVAHFFPALLLAVWRAARSHRRGFVCPGERLWAPISERHQYIPPHRDGRSGRAHDTVVRHRAVTRRSRDAVPVYRSLVRQRHRPDTVVDVQRHTLFDHDRISGPLRFPAEDHDPGQAFRRCG